MVKKIAIIVFVILIIGALDFYIRNNKPDEQNIEAVVKEQETAQVNFKDEEFIFENTKYTFSIPDDLVIKKSKTGQFQSEDIFQIVDKDAQEKISFTILDIRAEGPIKQSMASKNELGVIINNFSGIRFTNSDPKDVYMLSDDKYVYLWTNKNIDTGIFNTIVNSFKKQ